MKELMGAEIECKKFEEPRACAVTKPFTLYIVNPSDLGKRFVM